MQKSGINWDDGYTEASCGFIDDPQWKQECKEHFDNRGGDSGGAVVEWGGWSHYVDENGGVCNRAVADCGKDKYGKFKAYANLGGRCRDAEKSCNRFLDNRPPVTAVPPPNNPDPPSPEAPWSGWLSYLQETGNKCVKARTDCIKQRSGRFAPYVKRGGRCRDAVSWCEKAAAGLSQQPPPQKEDDGAAATTMIMNPNIGQLMKKTIHDFLVNGIRVIRYEDMNSKQDKEKLQATFGKNPYCAMMWINMSHEGKDSALFRRQTRRVANTLLKNTPQCPLYSPWVLYFHYDHWKLDGVNAAYHTGNRLQQWVAQCNKAGNRWAVVHTVITVNFEKSDKDKSVLNEAAVADSFGRSWSHAAAIIIDLRNMRGTTFDSTMVTRIPFARPGSNKVEHITFFELVGRRGIGSKLFPNLPGLKWVEPYSGRKDRHESGLQSWIEQDVDFGGVPWWIGDNDPRAKKGTNCWKAGGVDFESAKRGGLERDTEGLCTSLVIFVWCIALRLQYWDMPRIAYTVREIMEGVLASHKSSVSEKDGRQILRRRIVEWAFSVYECKTRDDFLDVMGRGSRKQTQCGVLCNDTTRFCYKNRIPDHLHCADHVRKFYRHPSDST